MTKILGEQFKDFKKGDLIKRLQKKFGKNKVNENTSMKKIMELMGKKEGGVTEGIEKIKAKSMLTGGQSKIDMNKNNKIDAEDFKILRQNKMQGGGIAIKGTKFKGVF